MLDSSVFFVVIIVEKSNWLIESVFSFEIRMIVEHFQRHALSPAWWSWQAVLN